MPEERKLVTILFADVAGSTALGEGLDPEDIRALMGRYYEHARQVVSDHGGTLEKFIGDAAMAVFGLPHAHGDDAERAVAAAVALRGAVENDSVLKEMTLRIGVNSGEVVATSDPSSGDFLVTGDAVNMAARLQQCANPGEILTSERTRDATAIAFLFGEGRKVEIKGKRDPLRAFPVDRMCSTRQVDRPPLVGRKQDLMQLALLQARALGEQRPQLVSIVAPAGTGKTRLLEEFLGRLDPNDAFQVAVGRCPPYGQTLTYWPLRGLLQGLVGEIERDRVIDAFARGGNILEDASRLADLVLAPLGIESEVLTQRETIFNAWRLLIETQAKEAPRIVVFEDLHWASDSLLDLVEHVMHPRSQTPLLIIAISRPELLDRRPTWGGGGRQNFTALVLELLNEAQTAELVEWLAGDLPEAIQERIVERSGGNPFFATELARGIAERAIGVDAQDLDVVPDTVHAAVLARLDALSPIERSVVRAASVAGRAFRPATLAAIVGDLGPTELDAAIEGLVARDLAVPGEGDAYNFRHILIREVAYGTLSRAERIRMHEAAAAWLEEFAQDRLDEFAELIAYHYREAVMLSRRAAVPLPLPIDPANAVYFLERAGELASRSGAFAEARTHLENAISIASENEQATLYEKLGDCTVLSGSGATDAYQRGLDRWRAEGADDPLLGARLLRKLMRFSEELAPAEAAAMRAEARSLAEKSADEDELWRVRVTDLYELFERGDVSRAETERARAEALAGATHFEESHDWQSWSEALECYGGLSITNGAHEDAIAASERRFHAHQLPALERGEGLAGMAYAYAYLGDYQACTVAVRDALAKIRPGEPIIHLGHASAIAAGAAWLAGYWSEMSDFIAVVEEARHQLHDDPSFGYLGWGHLSALVVALAREDQIGADAAASFLERTFPTMEQMFTRAWRAMVVAYRDDDPARLDLEPGKHRHPWELLLSLMFLNERAILAPAALVALAASLADSWKFVALIQCVHIARALAAGAPRELAVIIDDAGKQGLIPHARMRIVLAQRTGDPAPLDQARPVLERLEDRQFLRRLEEVAASLR